MSLSVTSDNLFFQRILNTLEVPEAEKIEIMELHGKWGCDGSSGHRDYMQKERVDDRDSEESMFLFSFVPLRLTARRSESEDESEIL